MLDRFPNIAAIGIELEGGWHETPCRCHRMVGDGSVIVSSTALKGEIPIGPFQSWATAAAEIRSHYPDVVNRTCGLHVHLSFPTPGHYSAIMSARFEQFLHARLMRYGRRKKFSEDGPFMQRLRGRNTYCASRYTDERATAQSITRYKGGERYAFLNYCYGLHTTVELRALPAFQLPGAAVNAVEHVCESFEFFLSRPGALVPDVYTQAPEISIQDEIEDFAASVAAGTFADLAMEIR